MALSKKPVNGMKDILPEEMQIRELCAASHQRDLPQFRLYADRDTLYGKYCKPEQ